MRAVTPDKAMVPLPEMWVYQSSTNPYRFVPNRQELVFLARTERRLQEFSWVDLETGQQRPLTDLKPSTALIQSFDISLDGKQIVFDRVKANSDIVLMDLRR